MTASSAFEAPQPLEQQSDIQKNSGLSNICQDLLKESRLSSINKGGSMPDELIFNPTNDVATAMLGEMPNGGPRRPIGTVPPIERVSMKDDSVTAMAPLDGKPVLRPKPGSQHPSGDSIMSMTSGQDQKVAITPADLPSKPTPGDQVKPISPIAKRGGWEDPEDLPDYPGGPNIMSGRPTPSKYA